jgi:hypothetical protein
LVEDWQGGPRRTVWEGGDGERAPAGKGRGGEGDWLEIGEVVMIVVVVVVMEEERSQVEVIVFVVVRISLCVGDGKKGHSIECWPFYYHHG